MDTDTAIETKVVTVAQPLEQELFGAGVRVRERVAKGLEVKVEFDDTAFRQALEAVPLPELDEAMGVQPLAGGLSDSTDSQH